MASSQPQGSSKPTGAASSLTAEQIAQYRQVFDLFDKDHTGDITADELGEVMRALGLNPSESELHDLVAEVDVDKNGRIDFDELLHMLSHTVKEVDMEQELLNAFKVFDADGSGTISAAEMRNVMRTLGENLKDDEIDELMKLADKNGDGSIDYHEFAQFMKAIV